MARNPLHSVDAVLASRVDELVEQGFEIFTSDGRVQLRRENTVVSIEAVTDPGYLRPSGTVTTTTRVYNSDGSLSQMTAVREDITTRFWRPMISRRFDWTVFCLYHCGELTWIAKTYWIDDELVHATRHRPNAGPSLVDHPRRCGNGDSDPSASRW